MPNAPGVRFEFQDVDETVTEVAAELPTLIVGPLYQVFEKETSDTGLDPLGGVTQSFSWPSKPVGGVVDLAGTRNGLIDSQRKLNVDYIPTVYLVDGAVETQVNDGAIEGLDQDGFDLVTATAISGLERGTFSAWAISVNGDQFLYAPAGGLSTIQVGDKMQIDGSGDYTVATVSDTIVTFEESITSDLDSSTRIAEDETASDTVDISPATTSGRITVDITGTTFSGEVPSIAVGDVVVTGIPMTGLTGISGAIDDSDTSYDDIDGLTFGVNVSLDDVDEYIVRVNNTTEGQHYFTTVSAIDTTAGTLTVADAVGSGDGDVVQVTIYRAQRGYVEAIASGDDSITVVVPETFSDANTFVDIYSAESSCDAYPDFGVKVSYRALRADLADEASSVSSESDFLAEIGHSSVDYRDGLGWAMRITLTEQPNNRAVYYIPVDLEPDGSTGLPSNFDITAGYANALEVAESIDVYNVVCLDHSTGVQAALKSHVDAMSTEEEGMYRRGYFIQEVPLGSTNSITGILEPGKVAGGVAAAASDGNKVLRDDSVDFVTEAGVVAGTNVVITFPSEYAGTYTALGTTTDSDLILDGADWNLTKEFSVASGDLNTPSTGTHTVDVATADTFNHVEAGDYVEVTEGGTRYRLKVSSVNGAGTQLTCEDEVPGDLDFGTGNSANASSISVIRSWISPGVQYYIDPLTRSQQAAEIVGSKSITGERYTLVLNGQPNMDVGLDDSGNTITADLDPTYVLCAIAAKRSGMRSYDEVTGLFLTVFNNVQYAYNHFKNSQMKTLSDAGLCLLKQRTASAQAYVRDMITSDTTSGIVSQEELVIANADWIGKTLSETFAITPGTRLDLITPRLLGIRTIQLDTLLASWKGTRIVDYEIISVEQNSLNKRQTDIKISLTLPVAEKEVKITIQRTV